MDSKQLTSILAEKTGLTAAAVGTVISAFSEIIAGKCAQLDSVALPGFGTFTPAKTDEYIVDDPDGGRILMPPAVKVQFNPSIVLRKKL